MLKNKKITLRIAVLLIILISATTQVAGKIIQVKNPGNNNDIQPAIKSAVSAAVNGDIISIPEGIFVLNENVTITKFISFKGAGIQKTIFYRSETVSDYSLSNVPMLYFNINKNTSSNITITDITFRSKKPSVTTGDGLSRARDIGIQLVNCIDFVIARCRFEYFGSGAISVEHTDGIASGLICQNEFYHNMKGADGLGLGYGVVVYGANKLWITDPKLGSKNFIFIEDNYFDTHRHAIAAGGSALYVARYNTITNNLLQHAIDTHSAQMTNDHNYFGSRAVEIYKNKITNSTFKDGSSIVSGQPADKLNETAILMRSGDAIVYDNTVVGYRFAVGISVYPRPAVGALYPLFCQPGYLSGLNKGAYHTGTDSISSDGDLFAYNNTFTPWVSSKTSSEFYNYFPALFKQSRDYHLVAKPGYTPFIYPHPLVGLLVTSAVNTDEDPDPENFELTIYPNPATNELSILFSKDIKGDTLLELLDISGRVILTKMLSKSTYGNFLQLNISHIKSGMYFLRTSTEKYIYQKKIMIVSD